MNSLENHHFTEISFKIQRGCSSLSALIEKRRLTTNIHFTLSQHFLDTSMILCFGQDEIHFHSLMTAEGGLTTSMSFNLAKETKSTCSVLRPRDGTRSNWNNFMLLDKEAALQCYVVNTDGIYHCKISPYNNLWWVAQISWHSDSVTKALHRRLTWHGSWKSHNILISRKKIRLKDSLKGKFNDLAMTEQNIE